MYIWETIFSVVYLLELRAKAFFAKKALWQLGFWSKLFKWRWRKFALHAAQTLHRCDRWPRLRLRQKGSQLLSSLRVFVFALPHFCYRSVLVIQNLSIRSAKGAKGSKGPKGRGRGRARGGVRGQKWAESSHALAAVSQEIERLNPNSLVNTCIKTIELCWELS